MTVYKDKRLFKRYKQKTDFNIIIGGNYYNSATVDFSLSGLCIFIEGKPPVQQNSSIDFKIEDLNLDVHGRVVWIKDADNNLLVGIEKLEISGLLRIYPLSDILLDIQRSDLTGMLEIEQDPIHKCIYIKNGTMIFAVSNQQEDHLEEILLRTGRITIDQYYQSVNMSKTTGKHLGAILIKLGFLKPDELVRELKYQVEEIILSLFNWDDGKVRFIISPLPDEIITFKLSAANLIFKGFKRINKPEYFKNICPSLDAILYFSNEPMNLFQDINIDEEDRYVLSLLDTKLTVKEILAISSLGQRKTTKIIGALLGIRMIEKKGEKVLEDQTIIRIIKKPQKEIDSVFIEKVDDLFERYQAMNFYSILGIKKSAAKEEIRMAYYTLAKEFHPDRHFQSGSESLKGKLNAIFSYITEAYQTLSDPNLKMQYDRKLTVSRSSARTAEDKSETARVWYQKGKEAFKMGLFNKAVELLKQAVYLDPSIAAYHYYLGMVYEKLKRFHDAQKAMVKAIEIDPYNADYHAVIGNMYLELGFHLRAKSSFEKALTLNPLHKKASEGMKTI